MNVRSRLLIALVALAGCQRVTNPSGYWFDEAQALADAGKYDEAIPGFERVAKDYPKSPEAGKVPLAVAEVNLKQAKGMWDAGQYLDAGHAYMEYAMTDGVTDGETRDAALYLAAGFAFQHDKSPLIDAGLKFATDLLGGMSEQGSAKLKPFADEVSRWACDSRKSFPAWTTCSGVSSDVDDGLPVAIKRAETAKAACGRLLTLAPACSSDASAEITALPTAVAALEANIVAAQVPVTFDYDNLEGNWDCRAAVWEFDIPVIVDRYRLAKNLNMFGKITNHGYFIRGGTIEFLNPETAATSSWEEVALAKEEMRVKYIRTSAGRADADLRCLRVHDTKGWKAGQLWGEKR